VPARGPLQAKMKRIGGGGAGTARSSPWKKELLGSSLPNYGFKLHDEMQEEEETVLWEVYSSAGARILPLIDSKI